MKNEYYVIYSQKMMAKLILDGFVLIGMREDRKGTGKNVFIFKKSKELVDAIKRHTK